LHEEAIALFKQESESGADADARNFAASNLPALTAHLEALHAL
jgi:hypothetical protein